MKCKLFSAFPVLALSFFAILYLASPLFAQRWTWQSPLPQGFTLHDVDAEQSSNLVAVGEEGTIIRSTDGGSTWVVRHSSGGVSHTLNSISFGDLDSGTVVGHSGTILRTTDGGATWRTQASGTSAALYGVSFTGPDLGIAVGAGGIIIRTSDGGIVWTIQESGTNLPLFDVCLINDRKGVVVGANGTILRTTDSGLTWTSEISGTTKGLRGIAFADSLTGVSVGRGVIVRTTDGGVTWTEQLANTVEFDAVSLYANMGLACGPSGFSGSGFVFRSTDYGLTWTNEYGGAALFGISLEDVDVGIVVGENGAILATSDGGKSWTTKNTWVTKGELNDCFFTNQDVGITVGGNPNLWPSAMLLRTTDGGTTWRKISIGDYIGFGGVTFLDSLKGFAVGAGIFRTIDGGLSWEHLRYGGSLHGISFGTPSTGTAVGLFGTILRTTDGGATWFDQIYLSDWNLYDVAFTDASTGFVVGGAWASQSGTIHKTTNGGISWEQQLETSVSLNGVSFVNRNVGTVVGHGGTILRTTDAGLTWLSQSAGTDALLQQVQFIDANVGCIIGWEGGLVLYTTDGGDCWTSRLGGTTLDFRGLFLSDANRGTMVGVDLNTYQGIILHTTTGGTGIDPPPSPTLSSPLNETGVGTNPILTWEPLSNALWYTVQVSLSPVFSIIGVNQTNISATSLQMSGLETETTYYWQASVTDSTGTSGWSEVWSFTTSLTDVGDDREELPQEFTLSQNYPNPFNPTTTFAFSLRSSVFANLSIYDLLGREIATLVNEEKAPGTYEVTWDAEGQASGVYIYRISAGPFVQTRKLIILK